MHSVDYSEIELKILSDYKRCQNLMKSRAKKIKREKGINHTQALDLASQEFGFESYKNFLNLKERNEN